ncbi:hypothetical protein GCM10010413_37150 [Promicromonospora sukumoe]|uniref:Lanthionine synthetase-like protein n=1 Tax=Promicromonospora sukumoe TaxID=88382 RepID=A0A7W3J7D5_9MICO|nr:lanthionine synthetase LanC family protein [Promicromonospora sukumoe]MBA8807655.1 hypothetical protein [Promicromonospora sukumoe]
MSSSTPQSLADGELARTLVAVEMALTSQGSWDDVTDHLLAATSVALDTSVRANLFHGVPALAFVVDATGPAGRARWARQLAELDGSLVALVNDRLAEAAARWRERTPVSSGEFDLMTGLAGLTTVLLRRAVHVAEDPAASGPEQAEVLHTTLVRALAYLVDRARNRVLEGAPVPGWWSSTARSSSPTAPGAMDGVGGHAYLGFARGGAGILAVLAAASRAGHAVPGQDVAIRQIASWYERWRQQTSDGVVWWPTRIGWDELESGSTSQEPSAPTWAHGTPGIGRALQMAAIALGDPQARIAAEGVIASCLTRSQLDVLTEPDLYAGTGGMYLTVLRAAEDAEGFASVQARTSMLTHRVGAAADAVSRTSRVLPDPQDTEFLHGRFGTRLVFQALQSRAVPVSGADAVLGTAWVE